MSILFEVMKSVEEIEWSNLNERLPFLMREVHLCKTEVFKFLDDVYVEFIQKPVKIPNLTDKLSQFQQELKALIVNCEEATKRDIHSTPKYNEYKTFLDQAKSTLQICSEVNNCYYIHERLMDLRLYKNNYEKSLEVLKEIRDNFNNDNSLILTKYFKKHFTLAESAMHFHFGEIITSKYHFGVNEENTVSYIKVNESTDISNSIELLLLHFDNIEQLQDLIDFIWEFIIVPIVTCDVVMMSDATEIKLKIMRKKKPHYKDVFSRLNKMNNFLTTYFDICIDSTKKRTLLDYIANQLQDRISSLIISNCLQNIPKNVGVDESFDYEGILKQVEALQIGLNRVKLVTDDSLVRYSKDLQQIHIIRSHEIFFSHMKTIMSQTNYEIVRVGSPFTDIPSMSISSVVQELHNLSEKILLTNKNKQFVNVLFDVFQYFRIYTSKDIHGKTSREVALLYNNYFYMAHELREWNTFYSHILEDATVPLFKDEAILFQSVGEEVLESFLFKKKEMLKSQLCELSDCKREISADFFEATLRKNLREVQLLVESWYDLLSQKVFNKYIGDYLNVLCNFLINFILKFESIPKNLIEKMSEAFIDILKVCKTYFVKDYDDLGKFIDSWARFEALSYILQSDLVEIEINKYHELLKSNFKAIDVKKVFRAVFEQCEKRDSILSHLYD